MIDHQDWTSDDDPERTEQLQVRVDGLAGAVCVHCGQALCGHHVLFSIAMGTADRPHCLDCLARSLGRESKELGTHLREHFAHRPCFDAVWRTVTEREERQHGGRGCRRIPKPESAAGSSHASSPAPRQLPDAAGSPANIQTVEWDAEELACGELLLQLRQRLRALAPGTTLVLTARDRGAVHDIPSWCRLTGHRLLVHEHPVYRIERKSE